MSCTRRARTALLLFRLPLLFVGLSACEREPAPPDPRASVLQVQADRFQAVIDADIEALDAILAPDLVYTHSTGRVESKADFMQSIGSGSVDYIELTPTDSQVRLFGDVAVVNGDVNLHVAAGSREHRVSMRFIEVYTHSDEGWRLVAWQSTQIQ